MVRGAMSTMTEAMRPATRPVTLTAVVVVLAVVAAQAQAPRSQQFARSQKAETSEIARQNHITQQILAQYLQQRLFPQLRTPAAAAVVPPGRPAWSRPRPPTTAAQAAAAAAAARERFRPRERDPPDSREEEEEEDAGTRDEEEEEEERERTLSREEEDQQKRREEGEEGEGERQEEERRDDFFLGRPPPPIDIFRTPEGLQSVESEHVANVYLNGQAECTNCVDEGVGLAGNRWTMPLLKLGEKRYYLGIFFKANWYRAAQYCRYHGMHLASINSQEENDKLEKHIRDFGLGNEHFWTSGTDQAEEGTFFWMSTGRPITFENWNAGEPNNFRYENGEEEHCMELWNRDGKGLKWNDSPCSFETFFVCEVQ